MFVGVLGRRLPILGVIVAGLLVSTAIALAPTEPASAVTRTSALSPSDQAKSFAYYKALRNCFATGAYKNSIAPEIGGVPVLGGFFKDWTMSANDAVNFDWFHKWKGVVPNPALPVQGFPDMNVSDVGVIIDDIDGDGVMNCGPEEGRTWIGAAAQLWGYDSGPELLCALDFGREVNQNNCAQVVPGATNDFHAPGGVLAPSTVPGNFDSLWTGALGSNGTGIESIGAGEYQLYLQSFKTACRAISPGSGDYTIYELNEATNTLRPVKYGVGDRDRGTGYSVRVHHGLSMTCQQLADILGDEDSRAVQAYRGWLLDNNGSQDRADPGEQDCDENGVCQEGDTTSCAVDGVGWIVCPVVTFAAGLADSMFGVLSDGFLKVGVSVVNTDPAAGPTTTYNAWRAMQAIANVILVIGFLIIIFSQLTGLAISNYGVKKTLPRLIIVAILINVSFVASQIAVDVSNILGYSLRDLFTGLAEQATAGNGEAYDRASGNVLGGTNSWANLAGGILVIAVAGTAGFFMLSMLGTVLGAALLALLMILLILVARQAIIVLAIVTAPVAIALYLLPNTEHLTKQWWKIFSRMLLLFPIISLIFGASTLAAVILRDSFGSVIEDNDSVNWLGQIMAAGIQVIPLFATPLVLKGALNAVPIVGNVASKLSGRANANLGRKLGESYKGSVFGRGRATRKAAREQHRERRWAERVSQGGLTGAVATGLAGMRRTGSQRAQADAVMNEARGKVARAEAEEVKQALTPLEGEVAAVRAGRHPSHVGTDVDAFLEARATSTNHTTAERAAAMHQAAALGRDGVIRRLAANPVVDQERLQRAITGNAGALVGKAPDVVKGAGPAFATVTGSAMANFSAGTAEAHIRHVQMLHAAATAPGATPADQQALDTAVASFNSAVEDITRDPHLQAAYGGDVGLEVMRTVGAGSAAFQAYAGGNMHGLAAIQGDGKIR